MASFQQQKKRKGLDKEAEELMALGGENEKQAIKDTQRIYKEKEAKHQAQKDKTMELLMGASKGDRKAYIRFMAGLLERRMQFVDWPTDWAFIVTPTDEGVVLELTHQGRLFRTAFRPCGDAVYDLNAVEAYGIRTENTIEKVSSMEIKAVV